MPALNKVTIRPRIWIPPIYTANWKLTVTRSDDTVDDVTDIIIGTAEIEDSATHSIGRFEFTIPNPNETYTDVWTGMEAVKFYSDYATKATTLRFLGRIEKVSYNNNELTVKGRSEALYLLTITVTKSYTSQEAGEILKDLLDTYGDGRFTYTNVNTSSTILTLNWVQKPFWDCVQELCIAAGFDAYVDSAADMHFFEAGSVKNPDDGIAHDMNLIEVGDFADDIEQVKNRIIVYGAEIDGIQILYTAEDTNSQDDYGVREEIVTDDNITSYIQAKDYGDYLLAEMKDPPVVGDVKAILLAMLQPGEQIRVSDPENNIPLAYYTVITYKHELSHDDGYFTTITINKEPRRISRVVADIIQVASSKEDTSQNPHELRYSFPFFFNSDSGTHNNTEITEGVLKPTAGSGDWTSPNRVTSNNITHIQVKAIGNNLAAMSFQISGNGGLNYETAARDALVVLSTSLGKALKIKVTFSDANAEIDSLNILYKTS